MLIRHRALCSFAIEHYAHLPSSIMLIRHRVLCSFDIEHYATRTRGLQALLLSVSLVGCPCLVDAVPEVVDALAPDNLDKEGKEGADEHLLDDQLLGDTRLVDAHADNGLAHLSRCRAGGEDGDVATQLLPVADIDGQARLIGHRPGNVRHLPAGCVGRVGEIEMLLGLRSYGQDLVVAAVDVDVFAACFLQISPCDEHPCSWLCNSRY